MTKRLKAEINPPKDAKESAKKPFVRTPVCTPLTRKVDDEDKQYNDICPNYICIMDFDVFVVEYLHNIIKLWYRNMKIGVFRHIGRCTGVVKETRFSMT